MTCRNQSPELCAAHLGYESDESLSLLGRLLLLSVLLIFRFLCLDPSPLPLPQSRASRLFSVRCCFICSVSLNFLAPIERESRQLLPHIVSFRLAVNMKFWSMISVKSIVSHIDLVRASSLNCGCSRSVELCLLDSGLEWCYI